MGDILTVVINVLLDHVLIRHVRLERLEDVEQVLLVVGGNRAPILLSNAILIFQREIRILPLKTDRHTNQHRLEVVEHRVSALVRESVRLVPEREGVRP